MIPKEIQKLADYLMKEWQGDIGLGDPIHGESAVDCAIRLLRKVKIEKSLKTCVEIIEDPSRR